MLKLKHLTILIMMLGLISCTSETKDKNNEEDGNTPQLIKTVSPKEFSEELEKNDYNQLVDVRTPGEFKRGHIKNSVNANISDGSFDQKINDLDKDKPVFVYCLSGGRSGRAASILKDKGFTMVYDLDGGINRWRNMGMETTTDTGNKDSGMRGMDKDDFMKLVSNSDKMILVDFNAEWCMPCKKLSPILDKVSSDMAEEIKLVKIDVDENPELSKELQISSIPLMHLYKNGELVWNQLGLTNESNIKEAIKKNI